MEKDLGLCEYRDAQCHFHCLSCPYKAQVPARAGWRSACVPSQRVRGPAHTRSPVLVVPFPPGAVLDSLESSAESSGPTCSFLDGEIKLRAGSTSLRAVVSKDQAGLGLSSVPRGPPRHWGLASPQNPSWKDPGLNICPRREGFLVPPHTPHAVWSVVPRLGCWACPTPEACIPLWQEKMRTNKREILSSEEH